MTLFYLCLCNAFLAVAVAANTVLMWRAARLLRSNDKGREAKLRDPYRHRLHVLQEDSIAETIVRNVVSDKVYCEDCVFLDYHFRYIHEDPKCMANHGEPTRKHNRNHSCKDFRKGKAHYKVHG